MFYMCIQNILICIFLATMCVVARYYCACDVCIVCADFLMMWHCIFMYSQNPNDISMVNKIKIVIDYI